MAGRKSTPLDDEKRSYGTLWLISALLLFVGALWAVADDNIFRRAWKKYQAEFGRIEIQRGKDAIAAEQARLDADPEYQAAVKALADAQASVDSGENAEKLRQLDRDLTRARQEDQSKDLNLRFVKSELEELRFLFDDALHHGRPTEAIAKQIEEHTATQVERQKVYADSQARIADLEGQIKAVHAEVKTAEDALAKLTATRDALQDKLVNTSLGYLPGPKVAVRIGPEHPEPVFESEAPYFGWDWQPKIPKIQQVVLPDFDRNNFDQLIGRVDRCTSCHAGIDKVGFEDLPNPWKTHPNREALLGKHPIDKFGCTPCHGGVGEAVNNPHRAHGNFYDEHGILENVEFVEHPLNRGEKVEALCIKCHQGVQHLAGAETIAKGEKLFEDLGCHGCHLTEGYEDLAKQGGVTAIGPSLRRIGAKADPGWLVRWIKNPHEFRPRTRMPNFMFSEDQATAIAAYLLSTSHAPSEEWLTAHPVPAVAVAADSVAQGKALVDSLGCRACHALAPDEVAGQVGSNKDIAPNLSHIAEKTDARWIYHWIRNPRGYSAVARMPSLRLSEDEARVITAYLSTLGERRPVPDGLADRLADPATIATGEKLVRKYGCAGCHDIPGMETESRIGVELSTFGSKTKEELFFGDRTDIRETWDDWTYNKLLTPRTYETKWIEQLMPQFDLADEDIKLVRAFLSSRTEGKVPVRYQHRPPGGREVVEGRLLVARYNCTGCHVIEDVGGDIRRLYADSPTLAPPILRGEGEKVQANWLFGFLKGPSPIRPWLKVRMPTFGLSDEEAATVIRYFESLDQVAVPYVHIEAAAFKPASIDAGRLLVSKDYFDCFSCHQRGAQKPQGPPEGWAPDLALAHTRLNPDWIPKWITDPQKVMPGTKMPSFYPGGPPDVLEGNDEAQIRALRDYIISLGLPERPASPQQAANVVPGGAGASQ
jgi:mono/diheme cytochrome c family protein